MEDQNKKEIRKYKKDIDEQIIMFRRQKQKDLYNFCIEHGGHYFYDWQRKLQTMFFSEYNHFVEERICSTCRFVESRKIDQ